MNQSLPQTSAEITYDADQASAKAFANAGFKNQNGDAIDFSMPALPDPRPADQHFIEKPELPAEKSEQQFVDEFLAETGYPGTHTEAGDMATEQVVHVDFAAGETPVEDPKDVA